MIDSLIMLLGEALLRLSDGGDVVIEIPTNDKADLDERNARLAGRSLVFGMREDGVLFASIASQARTEELKAEVEAGADTTIAITDAARGLSVAIGLSEAEPTKDRLN